MSSGISLIPEKYIIALVVVMAFTKRAQFPFSSWLPFAMAAPTPISSLVHSSTLVTAGIVLILKFIDNYYRMVLAMLLLTVGTMTRTYSGTLRTIEKDLKKLVALSTLNQLSFMFLVLAIRMKQCCFFHLNRHAIFKRLLFLNVGIMIHLSLNQQDKRNFANLLQANTACFLFTRFRLFSLIGVVFTTGFFSKDAVLEGFILCKTGIFYLFCLF